MSNRAKDKQVGGSHYKEMPIQPIEYILRNGLGFCEGNVVKYVSRWRAKGGVDDLRKAVHYLELLIEHETADASPQLELELVPRLPPIPDNVKYIRCASDGTVYGQSSPEVRPAVVILLRDPDGIFRYNMEGWRLPPLGCTWARADCEARP